MTEKTLQNKFNIGDTVKFVGDSKNDAGQVLGFSFDGESFFYKISSRELDHEHKLIIQGVKYCREDELTKDLEAEVKND